MSIHTDQPDTNDLEQWWRQYWNCYEHRSWMDYRSLLAECIRDAEGGPLLDVGCGLGFLVECARQWGIFGIGLEGSATAVEAARLKNPMADIRSWQAGEPFPLSSETIGCCVLNEVIDHFTMAENHKIFSETYRVLKPGGAVIIKSPSKYNRFDQDSGHVTFFSPSEFGVFLNQFDLAIVKQPYIPQPLLGSSRLGWLLMRGITSIYRPESWSARIDTVARKPRGDA